MYVILQALSMAAASGSGRAVGGGSEVQSNAIKAAALAVYSVATSVQPGILVLAIKVTETRVCVVEAGCVVIILHVLDDGK